MLNATLTFVKRKEQLVIATPSSWWQGNKSS